MSAIDTLFQRLKTDGQKAFMPFLTAGDPDLNFTSELLSRLDGVGCHLAELGIPYSDPIADGPVIQASYTRALTNGTRLKDVFSMLGEVVPRLGMPVVTMVSYSIICRQGIECYLEQAVTAGVAGLIVPDLPIEESTILASHCRTRDLSLIQLITPTTPRERAIEIAGQTTGFIYYVSTTGITGERSELPDALIDNLKWLRGQTSLPICVGFGISKPEHATVLKDVCDGMIVGSAIVRRMESASTEAGSREQALDEIEQFAKSMLAAISA